MKGALAMRAMIAAMLAAFGLIGAAPAQGPGLKALAGIELGQWHLRAPDQVTGGRSICITDPQILLQIRHGGAQCSRFVIDDSPQSTTVSYSCPGSGHGRTTISVETPRLIRIDTQGVADGQPFALEFEGRRVGACARMGRH